MPNPFFWGIWFVLGVLVIVLNIGDLADGPWAGYTVVNAVSTVYAVITAIGSIDMAEYWFDKVRR